MLDPERLKQEETIFSHMDSFAEPLVSFGDGSCYAHEVGYPVGGLQYALQRRLLLNGWSLVCFIEKVTTLWVVSGMLYREGYYSMGGFWYAL